MTLVGLTEMKGPLLEAPEMLAVRLMVPEKPFRDVSVILSVIADPWGIDKDVNEAVRLKSLKVMGTVIAWVMEPLVAVTVTE